MYIYIHGYIYPAGGVLGVKNVEAIERCSLRASLEYRRALLRKDRVFFAERSPINVPGAAGIIFEVETVEAMER